MRRVTLMLLVGILLLPVPADAQTQPGPGLVLLVHHPYPDAADPLGFPYPDGGERGYYFPAYAHLDADQDGFDFPHMVMDGVIPVEGLPDGAPYLATLGAYEDAFDARRTLEAPAILEVAAGEEPGTAIVAAIPRADLSQDGLALWVALVEDHVDYEPPARLSNGVTDHRFTVRAIQHAGPMPEGPVQVAFDTQRADRPEQLYVAAWLQAAPTAAGRFEPHEVVQATIHRLADDAPTRQETKGVLMQLYSATWCDPCLFGDRAAETLVAEHGPSTIDPVEGARYYRATPPLFLLAAAAAGLAIALVRLPGKRGEEGGT